MNLNSVLIGSEDPKPLADYYTRVLGKPGGEMGPYTWWAIGNGGITVGPHDQVKGKNSQPGRLIWNIESADVRGDFDRLKAAGARVIKEPYDPAAGIEGAPAGAWIATFADPDDNYFQLVSPMSL
ncbi:MAG: VOC family protein [Candidatus Limnocylindria bacterium]